MRITFILILICCQLNGFSQSNDKPFVRAYHDKLELSKDIINSLQKNDFTKLNSILSSLVMPFNIYTKIIIPSEEYQELTEEKETNSYKILPKVLLSKDSTIYNKFAQGFYFGDLTNNILNDPDNKYLNKNFYCSFQKTDVNYTKNVVSNELEIIFETPKYIKRLIIKDLVTINNTLYCIKRCEYENIDKTEIVTKSMISAPLNQIIYKLEKENLVLYTNDYLQFENIKVDNKEDRMVDVRVAEIEKTDITSINTIQETKATKEVKEPDIFDRVEEMPSFPGGVAGLMKYLKENLRYPKLAVKNKLEGKIFVKFIVDKNGKAINPVILKDAVGGGCADEAIRLVNNMPKWFPGKQNGKAVKVFYTLPINFSLAD